MKEQDVARLFNRILHCGVLGKDNIRHVRRLRNILEAVCSNADKFRWLKRHYPYTAEKIELDWRQEK